ncbi:MAG: ABC transporter permease [Bacteroidales bacterium]|nr:ABC transporter permease [Bacteroidales bacterium]
MIIAFLTDLFRIVGKYKILLSLTTLGLAVTYAILLLIMMQLSFEKNINYSKDSDRIFRLDDNDEVQPFNYIHPYGIAVDIKDFPYIEVSATIIKTPDNYCIIDDTISTIASIACVDKDFFDMFPFELTKGNIEDFNKPGTTIISEKMAMEIFGTTDVIGHKVYTNNWYARDYRNYTISGIYKNSQNITIDDVMFMKITEDRNNYYSQNYVVFVKMKNVSDVPLLEDTLSRYYDKFLKEEKVYRPTDTLRYHLLNVKDIYYKNETPGDKLFTSGSKLVSYSLLAVSIMMLIASIINFLNLNLATIPLEIKCISLHKIMGISTLQQRTAMILQNVIISIAAFIIAMLIIKIINITGIFAVLNKPELALKNHIGICFFVGGLAILIGIFVSIYPIIKLTQIDITLAIKGKIGYSTARKHFMMILTIVQFTFGIILITASAFVLLQNRMMENNNTLNTQNVVAFMVDNELCQKHYEDFRDTLESHPGIENVAFSAGLLGGSDLVSQRSLGKDSTGEVHQCNMILTTPDIFKVFNINILRGSGFHRDSMRTTRVVFSRLADYELHCMFDFQKNNSDTSYLDGVVEDALLTSSRIKIKGTEYYTGFDSLMNYCYVRLTPDANRDECLKLITKTAKKINPAYTIFPEFYDDIIKKLYSSEISLQRILVTLGILTIMISILGLILIMILDENYNKKQIAIHKILGATNKDLLISSNLKYLKYLVISLIITIPVVTAFVTNWQKSFAEKIDISIWVFIAVFLIIVALIVLIITIQTLKTVHSNLNDSIKTE